jgi:aminoglycoside phosphotransferase
VTGERLSEESTHELTVDPDDPQLVVKRYRSPEAGKPEREWQALRLLHEHAPGLAPEPVRECLSAEPPAIVMRRVPGAELRGPPLDGADLDAIGAALDRLHRSVPRKVVEGLPAAGSNPTDGGARLHHRLSSLPRPEHDPVVTAAYDHARTWLGSDEARRLARDDVAPVFARGDHNLANFLRDGDRLHLVDFEDAGRGDRPSELAELVEHIGARTTPDVAWEGFLARCDLDPTERRRLAGVRRLAACMWLLLLLPGQPGEARNPPGTLRRQAERLLGL